MKMDHGQNQSVANQHWMLRCGMIAVMGWSLLWISGCSNKSESREEQTRKKQDQALQDPYGYGGKLETHDISGGDIGHFDRDAFRKDTDALFNP